MSLEDVAKYLGFEPKWINYLVNVDDQRRVVYFETPKVGCTTIKLLMQEAYVGRKIDFGPDPYLVHDRGRSPLLQLGPMSPEDRAEALFGASFSRFGFVRHPTRRAISAYRDKYANLNNPEREHHLFRIGLKAEDDPSLLEVLERMKDLGDIGRDIHFMTQNFLLGSGHVNFDFVGRFETFGEDLETILYHLYPGTRFDLGENSAFTARHATGADLAQISAQEEQLIYEMYRDDFERFNYSPLHMNSPVVVPNTAADDPGPANKPLTTDAAEQRSIQEPGNAAAPTVFQCDWFEWKVGQGLAQAKSEDTSALQATEREFFNLLFIELLERQKEGRGQTRDLIEFFSFAIANIDRSHAQILQDLWVLFMTKEKRMGYFVEFGACDGISLSNTLLLERDYDWNGILAEPNPNWIDRLKQNRKVSIDTDCVFPVSGKTVTFQCVMDEPELSRVSEFVPNDVHERHGNRKNMQIVDVQTVSLQDLLLRHGAPNKIDFMSVDTEGSEFEILSQFDFDRFDVHLLAVEHAGDEDKREKTRALLEGRGYKLWYPEFSRWDDWFYRE
ncbi:sulfotransferase family 2 domain-containing protein [Tropicimonas sp. IMCC34043]|uniref:sulfotransferase family 2 domain-containing protein n=1 Tax=Tropicimonas sp. IMCC34043 TaxID=2248760 RepID=UPI0018E4F274|nr:sulfotransferase family 2 domain-containing protein [Tropicimonas sp. IMCC34043]